MSVRECTQCIARTRKGRGPRCKNRTCIYPGLCRQHTMQLVKLVLKPSEIPGGGRGLFTTVTIPANTKIAEYTGEIKMQAEYEANPSGYGIAIPHGRVLDAWSTQSGIARMANDCRTANKRAGQCKGSNSRFVKSTRGGHTTVSLKSTKRIPKGGEIYVAYGRQYWGN